LVVSLSTKMTEIHGAHTLNIISISVPYESLFPVGGFTKGMQLLARNAPTLGVQCTFCTIDAMHTLIFAERVVRSTYIEAFGWQI